MSEQVYDIIGIGFGPAGIALAAAVEDLRESHGGISPVSVKLLEARPKPAWQPGLLLRGTDINHHFLRDFATPRNPRSRFTFANYLKEKGRLFHFGHLGGKVGRIEWADYVTWTADQLSRYVEYNRAVTSLQPHPSWEKPQYIRITTDSESYLARTVVLNTGPVVNIPDRFKPYLGEHFFHTVDFLPRIGRLGREVNLKFCLIGSGQSAGEAILYLHDEFRRAVIYSVHRRVGFKIYDLGHFSNECYFPEHVEYFYHLPSDKRRLAADDLRMTNYSSIDFEVSHALYWRVYEDRVLGQDRIRMLTRRQVTNVERTPEGYRLRLEDVYTGQPVEVVADVVVLGTGYREDRFPPLLEPLRPFVTTDDEGGPQVSFSYRVVTRDCFGPGIYLNGLSERTHGISDATSFSMMALKAQRILDDILAGRR